MRNGFSSLVLSGLREIVRKVDNGLVEWGRGGLLRMSLRRRWWGKRQDGSRFLLNLDNKN